MFLYRNSMSIKAKVYHTLQFNNTSKATVAINTLIITCIILSIPIDVFESLPDTSFLVKRWVLRADLIISILFAFEYILRVLTCTEDPRYQQPIMGRLKYMCTPLMLIDLFAICPFFAFGNGLLRVLRVFRILMLMRYTNAIELMNNVIAQKKKELSICGAFILMLWVWSSFMIFRAEHIAQPAVFRNMGDALWWSAMTFTTVGYGDIYPVTLFGRAIAVITVAMGLVLFAITTAVLTAGILQEIKKWEHKKDQPQL